MAERFIKVFNLMTNLYSTGCPIIVEAGALQNDTETGNLIAQIKMKNIGDKNITSCKVSLRAYENNGHELEGIKEFSYLDLNAAPGDEFGSKTPLFLPDATARSFSVTIEEIVFADNLIDSTIYSEWNSIPQQEDISIMLESDDLAEQFEIEVGGYAKFVPRITDSIFQCTCGSPNLKTNDKCYKCGNTYELLAERLLNREQLIENASERHAKEEEKKLIEEKKKKKTIKIRGAVAGAIALIIIVIVIAGSVGKQTVTFRDYSFKIPSYYEISSDDYSMQTYTNKDSTESVLILNCSSGTYYSNETFELEKQDIMSSIVQGIVPDTEMSSDGSFSGATTAGNTIDGKIDAFYDSEEENVYLVIIAQAKNSSNDYTKLVRSITKSAKRVQ